MKRLRTSLVLVLLAFTSNAVGQDLSSIDIPYGKYVLDNGLTLIVHEDHSSPQAFISVYYKVGSRDEKPGKTGFAHLFEHLMFNGTENYDKDYFAPVQDVGGTLNGDTWFDRTRYYQTVPITAVDMVLWLESERMGHLLGAVTQEKLDNQRGVVKNEKRRGDNRPYGLMQYRMLEGLFPKGHPYSWSTIGSLEDLNAASLDDVHAWFKDYYGAANTIVTVAGDVESAEVLESVKLYFGDIAPGNPVNRIDDMVPVRTVNTYDSMQDAAPNPLLSRNWVAPGRDHEEAAALRLATSILGGDETSRLYQALVKDAGIAVSTSASTNSHDLASMPSISIVGKAGASLDEARDILDRELRAFFEDGPTDDELDLAKVAIATREIKSLDSIGAKATKLTEAEFYMGSPDAYKQIFRWIDDATTESVRATAARWLDQGYNEIRVSPFGRLAAASGGADRSKLPEVTSYPDAKAPLIEDAVLSNGVKVRFVSRPGVPAASIMAVFDGNSVNAGDQELAYELASAMLDKGTENRTAEELKKDLKRAGTSLIVFTGANKTSVSVSTLGSKLGDAVELMSDVIRNPRFDEAEFQILKDMTRANIDFAKSTPSSLVARYINTTVFGSDHPLGRAPATGAEVDSVSTDDLRTIHSAAFRPEQLTFLVVGGVKKDDVIKELNMRFGKWKGTGDALPEIQVPAQASTPASNVKVILFDTPGAPQSNISAAHQIDAAYGDDHYALRLGSAMYGGTFLSRINANIREDKGWSYGVFAGIRNDLNVGTFNISAQVQTDKTAESITELLNEMTAISGDRPYTDEELDAVRNEIVRKLPQATSSSGGIIQYLTTLDTYGFNDDFIEHEKAAYDAVTTGSAAAAFDKHVSADNLIWFIAGDVAKIEEPVRDLGLGKLEIWDADGNKVR